MRRSADHHFREVVQFLTEYTGRHMLAYQDTKTLTEWFSKAADTEMLVKVLKVEVIEYYERTGVKAPLRYLNKQVFKHLDAVCALSDS